jgi:hypothetical protein
LAITIKTKRNKVVIVLTRRDEIELRLKAELDEAEQQLRHATLEEKPEARRRFRDALRAFSDLVLRGKLPSDLRCT